jgi:chromosome transmission fidelity protein 1
LLALNEFRYTTSWMHQIEAFLTSLINADEDGRVMISLATESDSLPELGCTDAKDNVASVDATVPVVEFKYLLLNPAEHFRQIVQEARSVILAGGTMSPVDDLIQHLFPYLPSERIQRFSCGHVVPETSLLAFSLDQGPSGTPFEFTFQKRNDTKMVGATCANASIIL